MTNNDNLLLQIRGIVRDETKKVVEKETRKIIQEEISPLKKDVSALKKDVSTLKKDVKKIDTKLDKTIDFFDNDYLSLKKRGVRVETNLGITPII